MMDGTLPPPDVISETPSADTWEDPPRSPPATGAPILSAAGFEGPLDWLLDMVRAKEIDLARLPIAALIDSFADALEAALARPHGHPSVLSRWGDWLIMAATLTQLRSKLLLAGDAPDARAAADEAEGLRRTLLERVEIGAVADWLERRPQMGREFFRRGRPERRAQPRGAEITDLLRACLVALRVPEELAALFRVRQLGFWKTAEALARIEELLAHRPAGGKLADFLPVIEGANPDREMRRRAAVASTLLASLELARLGSITVEQASPTASVQLRSCASKQRERTSR
jgi:segregation and condensation protein A